MKVSGVITLECYGVSFTKLVLPIQTRLQPRSLTPHSIRNLGTPLGGRLSTKRETLVS